MPVVKPSWITDSVDLGKLLDYKRYLLYTNQSTSQPGIQFPVVEKVLKSNCSTEYSNCPATDIIDSNLNLPDVHGQDNISNNSENSITSQETREPNAGIKDQQKFEEPKNTDRLRAPTKTASDPNFIEEFYNNSRLHLISTLGAEFKQLVGQLREKSNRKFPGREKLVEKGRSLLFLKI